jgi:adenine specific DNA methylase Mod
MVVAALEFMLIMAVMDSKVLLVLLVILISIQQNLKIKLTILMDQIKVL